MKSLAKKRSIKVFLLSIILAITLFLCGCNLFSVTKENYDKIQTGMTVAEVINILGNDYQVSANANAFIVTANCYVWQNMGKSISVVFLNGVVIGKEQQGL